MKAKKRTIVILIALMILSMTGCGVKNLDITKIKEQLPNLKDEKISETMIASNLQSLENPIFTEMKDVYDYEFHKTFQIDEMNLEVAIGAIKQEETDKRMFLIMRPIEGKEQLAKQQAEAYFQNLEDHTTDETNKNWIHNRKFLELDGLYVYFITEEPKQAEEIIKNSKTPIFAMLMEADDQTLKDTVNIDPALLEEYAVSVPMSITSGNFFLVLKPKAGKKDMVKKQADAYVKKMEDTFATYLPDQYEMIQKRKVEQYGDYLIYISSTDNNRVWNTIKNCKK